MPLKFEEMDTISATILEIRNDYENVFHITLEAQIPEGVALIRVDPAALGKDPVVSRQPTTPLQLIVTIISDPPAPYPSATPRQLTTKLPVGSADTIAPVTGLDICGRFDRARRFG